MITFEFLNSQTAAESLLKVPIVQLIATLERDWFELDYREMTPRALPENFYLQEAASIRPKPDEEETLGFVETWGRPIKAASNDQKITVSTTALKREVALLGQFGRFATEWFESDKQISLPASLLKLVERSLAVFHPRLHVGGSRNNFAGLFDISVAQWADDALNERSLKVCTFCGQRFTKQRGRSNSGRYRTDEQTKFCSHSCANREGNRRRRNEGKVT